MNWLKLVNILFQYANILDTSVKHCEKSRQSGGNTGQLKKLHKVPLVTCAVIADISLQRADFTAAKTLISMFQSRTTASTYLQQSVSLNHITSFGILSDWNLFNIVTGCEFLQILQAGLHIDLRLNSTLVLFLTRTILKGVQLINSYFMAVKRSAGVAPEVNPRNLLRTRTGDEACK